MENVEKRIRETAKELFEKGEIDLFIGYEEATLPLKSRPCFIQSKEGTTDSSVDSLVWNSFCSNNLAVFLPKLFETDPRSRRKDPQPKPKIGIVAKGCDLRSITTLIKERQVPRDNVVLIGVPCQGMIDTRKVEALAGGRDGGGKSRIMTGCYLGAHGRRSSNSGRKTSQETATRRPPAQAASAHSAHTSHRRAQVQAPVHRKGCPRPSIHG